MAEMYMHNPIDVEDLKKAAYRQMPLPAASPSEKCFWLQMRYIYMAYTKGFITAEQARKETAEAESELGIMQLWERLYIRHSHIEKRTELLQAEVAKFPTEENKDKLLYTVFPTLKDMRKIEI